MLRRVNSIHNLNLVARPDLERSQIERTKQRLHDRLLDRHAQHGHVHAIDGVAMLCLLPVWTVVILIVVSANAQADCDVPLVTFLWLRFVSYLLLVLLIAAGACCAVHGCIL